MASRGAGRQSAITMDGTRVRIPAEPHSLDRRSVVGLVPEVSDGQAVAQYTDNPKRRLQIGYVLDPFGPVVQCCRVISMATDECGFLSGNISSEA